MRNVRVGSVLVCLVFVGSACAADAPQPEPPPQIHTSAPAEVDSTARYLFYLHGAIIERAGERPAHPEFGVYEYRKMLEVLAEKGFVVVSEARAPGTDVFEYAQAVADQVRNLITAGVPASNISVVGFSKGGGIAAATSSILGADDVNFVFMGTCGPWLNERPEIVPRGRLLSLHEASDDLVGSCDDLFSRSGEETEHREIVIEIGGGHGAFYRPRPEWVEPVVEWASRPAS